ncbi:MAG TPA: phage portal protein [Acidimicrobiales bacterium]|nr:phage portal protein [Acidimicrobiales bacterium]
MSLFRARSAPAPERRDFTSSATIPSNSDGYRNSSGQHVTTDSALSLASFYGAVSLISDALSTMPIDTYRKRAGGRREELDSPDLLERPSGDLIPSDWRAQVFASALIRGNAYGYKDNFDSLGYPREIHLVHPDEVQVQRRSREDPTAVYRFGNEEIPRSRVFHLSGLRLPGQLTGISPVSQFAQSIGIGLASETFGAGFYGAGCHPTSILASDQQITQDQAKTIKARFVEAVRGKREPAVLGAGLTYQQIQVSPEEAMFLEALKYAGLEVGTMVFHIPPGMLGLAVEGQSQTYSNREQDEILFQTRALLAWAVRFEQHISRLLPGGQYIKHNFDAAVRVDLTTRYQAHALGITAGFLLPNEARELEDRLPLPDSGNASLAARNLVEMVQKVYLGVGVVLTPQEAREMLNRAGAGLSPDAPELHPKQAALAPPKEDPDE